MAYEQHIQEEPIAQFQSDGNYVSRNQNSKLISAPTALEHGNGSCVDCNICLDTAHDPVVTLCGHLYCWPCIYKWFRVQSLSLESDEPSKCPVCKANISQSSLVPLYGRGSSPSESNAKKPQHDLVIPQRPNALGIHALETTARTSLASHPNHQLHSHPLQPLSQSLPFHHQQYFPQPYVNHTPMAASSNFGGTAMTSFVSSTAGTFGEMVLARMFGGSSDPLRLFPYPYSNTTTHPLAGSISPRMTRQEMAVDKSLNRVSMFLFCCFVLCLLLF
ncbi:RING-type E3 ubiquitin transferase [Sarracenia purpurea var. burkii]